MEGRPVPPNQPQVGIGDGPLEGADPEFPILGENVLRRSELFVPPPLVGDTEELDNGGPGNGLLNNLDDVRRLVPGPVLVVNPAVRIEDEEVPVHVSLQQMEEGDLQAVRDLLKPRTDNNVITAQHLYLIMRNLRDLLPREGPYRIRRLQAEYARILRRTARVMTIPTREMIETTPGPFHSLGYDALLQKLQDDTPECPIEYGECLEKLCTHVATGIRVMGDAESVYIFKDREEFSNSLQSLAARLTSLK